MSIRYCHHPVTRRDDLNNNNNDDEHDDDEAKISFHSIDSYSWSLKRGDDEEEDADDDIREASIIPSWLPVSLAGTFV